MINSSSKFFLILSLDIVLKSKIDLKDSENLKKYTKRDLKLLTKF